MIRIQLFFRWKKNFFIYARQVFVHCMYSKRDMLISCMDFVLNPFIFSYDSTFWFEKYEIFFNYFQMITLLYWNWTTQHFYLLIYFIIVIINVLDGCSMRKKKDFLVHVIKLHIVCWTSVTHFNRKKYICVLDYNTKKIK